MTTLAMADGRLLRSRHHAPLHCFGSDGCRTLRCPWSNMKDSDISRLVAGNPPAGQPLTPPPIVRQAVGWQPGFNALMSARETSGIILLTRAVLQ